MAADSSFARVVHNVTTKLFEFLPSDDGSLDFDTLLFDFCEEIATESQNITARKKKQSKRIQNFEERMDKLHKLAENVNSNLKTGNTLQASRTIRGRLKPFVVSLFQNNCPENIDPAEYLFNEALETKKSHGSMMMLVYLHLADSFPSQPQTKAKISKRRGDCNMSERNYRTAALCFVDAADFYAKAKTPCVQTEHLEVLTELARSHMLCDDYKAAWKTCQEGMHLFGASVSKEENFLPLQTKLFSQAAQCLMSLATADHELEEVVSICKRGLVSIEMLHCSTRPKELVKYVKLNYKLRRCLVTALSRLNKVDESRKIAHEIVESLKDMAGVLNKEADVNDTDLFLVTALTLLHKVDKCKKIADVVDEPPEDIPEDIACVLDEDEDVNDTDLDADDLNICCCLYSWIGQAQILCGDNNAALIWLAKSLSKFLASGLPDTISMEQEFVELLDAITVAKVHFTQSNVTAFEETIELCMQILLKITDGVNMLPRFFEVVAKLYVDRGGEEAAVMLHERALSVVDCTGNFSDVKKARDAITTLLGHCHRRQSIKNTGKGTVEERNLAEKFYQLGLDSAENIPLKISYVGLLYDQECFEEADKVLRRIISENDELWDIQISFSYSSRILCSPGIKRYIEDHGECVTTAGILAYNLLVHVCVALGRKKEAVATCKKLSEKGEEVEVFVKSSSVMKYVLGSCQKALATLIDDQCFLKLENTTFPLSDSDLDILYSKLDEWTPALDQSEKTSVEWLSGELDGSFCCDIDSPTLPLVSLSTGSKGDTEEDLNIDVLEMIHAEEGIFDKPFVTQKAILKRWTIGDFYNVYETLGTLMCARGRLDGAIECYEYCLGMDEDYSHGKDLAAAVAELYQVKAMTALNEDKALYTRWMREAEECFNKLRLKEEKMDSFVARAFGSFLCRQGRFAEAITQFQNILDEKSETKITITSVDNLLISVYLQREVEARGKLILPLEILVYHEMVPAFLKLNKVDNAQESVQQMEKQVKRYRSAPEYALILSVLGYTHNDVGNTKKAKDIFLSVLQIIPGHKPVIDALET